MEERGSEMEERERGESIISSSITRPISLSKFMFFTQLMLSSRGDCADWVCVCVCESTLYPRMCPFWVCVGRGSQES